MSDHLQHELKKEFQLERMILFSDAVFAIAITLLAIELHVPDFDRHNVTDHLLLERLDELLPHFVGFLISFFLIGLYWVMHHRLFGYVINYDRRLLWLNLVFLLGIVLMPFSTGFYSTYIVSGVKVPIFIYAANLAFLGITNLLIWRHISNPARALATDIDPAERTSFTLRAILPSLVVIAAGMLYIYAGKRYGIWLLPGIPILTRLVRVYAGRRRKKVPVKS